jgi:hypothetical protein
LLPLGLTVVVYIYNQSRATIKENEQTIEALSREARQARADADMSKAQVTALQTDVKAQVAALQTDVKNALANLNAQMTQSSATIAALGVDAELRADHLANSIEQQRREAEHRDLEREAQMDRQQQDFEEKISLQVLQLQQIQQQVSVLDLILDIRSYEVGLLSDTYEDVQLSLNALIQYTYLDEEEDDGRQNTRRREAVHALGTFSHSVSTDYDWVSALKLRAIQHLELIALDDMTPQVRYEARRVLRELNGEGSGTTKPTPPAKTSTGRGRPRKSPHLPDQPTQADD